MCINFQWLLIHWGDDFLLAFGIQVRVEMKEVSESDIIPCFAMISFKNNWIDLWSQRWGSCGETMCAKLHPDATLKAKL